MEIALATPADAEEIAALVRLAFTSVAVEYGVETLPPLQDTAEGLRALLPTHVVLKAVDGGRIVGSVRGVLRGGTCEVGRLVVDPAFEGRGIGTALAVALEERFPEAERFELFTGHRSERSLAIYRRLGYVSFREERVHDGVTLVYLEKRPDRQVPEASG